MPAVVILVVEFDPPLLQSQILLCESRGFQTVAAESRTKAEQLLSSMLVDIVILGHSLSQHDREVLIATTRLIRPEARILVLHASGSNQPVPPDAAVDSRNGPEKVFEVLSLLLGKIRPQNDVDIPNNRVQKTDNLWHGS